MFLNVSLLFLYDHKVKHVSLVSRNIESQPSPLAMQALITKDIIFITVVKENSWWFEIITFFNDIPKPIKYLPMKEVRSQRRENCNV